MKPRTIGWLLAFGLAAGAALAYGQLAAPLGANGVARAWVFAALGGGGILMVLLAPGERRGVALACVWVPAVVLRALLLPAAPSDDVNRYLWEGRLVAEGESPYARTADAPELADFRDRYWEGMNHRDKATAYPPLAELLFAAVGWIAYSPMAFKLVFAAADLLALGGVVALLRRRGLATAFAGLYAFNPVVLVAFAGEGHFDALMVAALVWAVVAHERARGVPAFALACAAVAIKWVALPLLPFFLSTRRFVAMAAGAGVFVLPSLVFLPSLPELLAGVVAFGAERSFNGPIYEWLHLGLGWARPVVVPLMAGLLGVVVLWRWRLRREAPADAHARWILGALLLCAPTVHFWYLAWVLPLVCLRPSLPWLGFALSGGVYFLVWDNAAAGAGWGLEAWQKALFWGPFALFAVYEIWSTRGRVLFPRLRRASDVHTVAVVIPALNVARPLRRALVSLIRQTYPPDEIIVADGGSTDRTREVAREAAPAARIVRAEGGRGGQIAAGIAEASAEWVVVLHADAELPPEALAVLRRAVVADRSVLGGAFGQRFGSAAPELLLIEVLNEVRALFTRTAFGDQAQFFHRPSAVAHALMPAQPLMEDVEASWRTRETGGFLYLGYPAKVDDRKWRRPDWWRRFALVFRFVARYRWARLRGGARAERLSHQLFAEYYPHASRENPDTGDAV